MGFVWKFFYHLPNGESRLDVYSHVTSFLGSLNRDCATEKLNGRGYKKCQYLECDTQSHLALVCHAVLSTLGGSI